MTDLSAEAVRTEIARLRRESDQGQLLGSDLDQMRRIAAHAMERMRRAEDRADEAEKRLGGLEEGSDWLRGALLALRAGCLTQAGNSCRLCRGSWEPGDEHESDHHDGCPMRETARWLSENR